MYELDDGKDQLMTVLKLALANLAIGSVTITSRPGMLTRPGSG